MRGQKDRLGSILRRITAGMALCLVLATMGCLGGGGGSSPPEAEPAPPSVGASIIPVGASAHSITMDKDGEQIVLLSEDDMRLLDPLTEEITVLPFSEPPRSAAVDTLRGGMLVLDADEQMHFIAPASLAPYQDSLDVSPVRGRVVLDEARGLALLVHGDGARILFLDAVSGTLVDTLDAGSDLLDLAIHGVGGQVLAIDRGPAADELLLIDLTTRLVVERIALGGRFSTLAVDDVRGLVVLAREDHASVEVLDLASRGRITHNTELPVGRMALSTGYGQVALLGVEEGWITLLDLVEGLIVVQVHAPGGVVDVGFSERFHALFLPDPARQAVIRLPLPPPQPRLHWIDPEDVLAGGQSFALHLHGGGFVDGATVRVGDSWLESHWHSAAHLSVQVPEELIGTAGVLEVAVRNSAEGAESNTLELRVLEPHPVPRIDGLDPSEIPTGEAPVTVDIVGAGFVAASRVHLGAHAVESEYVSATRLTAVVPAEFLQATGGVPVSVYNPAPGGGVSNTVYLQVVSGAPVISRFTPASGVAGTRVTIHGQYFDGVTPGGNQVAFAGRPAVVAAATADRLDVIVPPGAETGPVSVTTAGGHAVSEESFEVLVNESFELESSDTEVSVPAEGEGSLVLNLTSEGYSEYGQFVDVSIDGLPAGISYSVSHGQLSLHQPVTVTLSDSGHAEPGTYQVTVRATGSEDGRTVTREFHLDVHILPPGTTTVSGLILQADNDRPFFGALVRLGEQSVYTDAAGRYLFVNPPLEGDQVVVIDGHTANTETVHYPSRIPMPVMIERGRHNRVMTSYIAAIDATRYTTIVPGQAATVTDPELSNYELRIPEGAVLYGWDGTPVNRVNVRIVPPDRLPIRPVPEGVTTRSVYMYYFYRSGGADPTVPIPVTMNNDLGMMPGDKAVLWYYDETPEPDPDSNQWRIMGMGTVSDDGRRIVSDPGVGIPRFCCGASFATPDEPPEDAPGGDACGPSEGNPVDLASGIGSMLREHGLGLPGPHSPSLSVGYNAMSNRTGPLGVGTWASYEWRLTLAGASATVATPQGIRYQLARGQDGVYRAESGRAGGLGMEVTTTTSLATLRFPDGHRMEFFRGNPLNTLLVAEEDRIGRRITYTRDTQAGNLGRLLEIRDQEGRRYRLDYLDMSRISAITDPLGRVQRFEYDAGGRLTRVIDFAGQATDYTWGADGRIQRASGAGGRGIHNFYDDDGRVVRQELISGTPFWHFDYQVVGRTVMGTDVRDPAGHVTRYRFNGQGYNTRIIDPLGGVTEKRYDTNTNLLRAVTDPVGRTTFFNYDGRGNRTSVRNVEDHTTLIDYHPRFNKPTRIVDALGRETHLVYTAQGDLRSITDPLGQTTTLDYDERGQVIRITDALGQATHFGYDAYGNVSNITDPLGRTWRYAHDLAGRMTSQTDPLGRTTRYQYDLLDRMTRIEDARGGVTELSYHPRGMLATLRNPNGAVIETREYDTLDRLIRRSDAAGHAWHYDYDPSGNLIRHARPNGQETHYTYDALNRPTSMTDSEGRSVSYQYNAAGRLSRVSDSDAGDTLYHYDRLDRLVREINPRGMIEYAYNAADQLIERRINGTEITTYDHDPAGRVIRISHNGRDAVYDWDAAGRLMEKRLPNGMTQAYDYDPAGQLLRIRYLTDSGAEIDRIEYDYDLTGQISARRHGEGVPRDETPFEATYDADNRMLTYNGHPLSYDDNGNLIRRETDSGPVIYTWDAHDRLIAIDGPHGSAAFRYDHLGRRIEKTVNGETVQYLYHGLQAVAELQGGAMGAVYHTGLMIDEVLARYTNAGDRIHLTDLLGSVMALTDDAGAIRTRYGYSAYGEMSQWGEGSDNPLQYTGRENDETGLYHYRARYYDPELKRFISRDPIGLAGGVNLYAYVDNDPLRWIDPEGKRRNNNNPRPQGQSLGGQRGTWHKGKFYQTIGQSVPPTPPPRPREPWETVSIADLLPDPSDWHDYYERVVPDNGCRLVCDQRQATSQMCPVVPTGAVVRGCQMICN